MRLRFTTKQYRHRTHTVVKMIAPAAIPPITTAPDRSPSLPPPSRSDSLPTAADGEGDAVVTALRESEGRREAVGVADELSVARREAVVVSDGLAEYDADWDCDRDARDADLDAEARGAERDIERD